MFIINAPIYFTTIWSMIKLFIDEKTKKKINIVGSDYKKKLLEYVFIFIYIYINR